MSGEDNEVAVGSVGHILKQTFKTLYPELHTGKADEEKQQEEEEVGAEGGEAKEGGEDEEGEGDGEGEGEGEGQAEDGGGDEATPAAEGEEEGDAAGEGGEEAGDGEEKGEDGGAGDEEKAEPTEEELLEREIQAEAERRSVEQVKAISTVLERRVSKSYVLQQFLAEQQQYAEVKDKEDAANLRKWGLVQNSEMPIGPSNLKVEPEKLLQYGEFGDHLIVARTLMKRVEDDLLERTGNLFKEKPAEIPSFSSMKEDPNYYKSTHTQDVRRAVLAEEREKKRKNPGKSHAGAKTAAAAAASKKGVTFKETAGDSGSVAGSVRSSRSGAGKGKKAGKPNPHEGLSAEQIDAEKKVLERMQRKLNFLRNPRHAKTTVVGNTIGANIGGSITSKTADKTFAKTAKQKPIFEAVPSVVEFTDYEANSPITTTLLIRNNSVLSRSLRVLPPKSRFFSMDLVSFPPGGGQIAPGMSCKVIINFCPNSLADFEDSVEVVTEQTKFTVPIKAFREPPELTLPLTLHAGSCMLGDRLDTTFECYNAGGRGRFRLFPASQWPRPESGTYDIEAVDIEPFTVTPSEFALDHGDAITLNIRFLPQDVQSFEREFVMVCDNCEVTTYKVTGESCTLDVQVTQMEGRDIPQRPRDPLPGEYVKPVDPLDAAAGKAPGSAPSVPSLRLGGAGAGTAAPAASDVAPLSKPPVRFQFGNVVPGVSVSKTFVLYNNTPVTLPFDWDLASFSKARPLGRRPSQATKPATGSATERSDKSGTARSNKSGKSEGHHSVASNAGAGAGAGTAGTAGAPAGVASAMARLPFRIEPASGSMPSRSHTSFTVVYSPSDVAASDVVARLMIAGMPKDPRKQPPVLPADLETVPEGGSEGKHSDSKSYRSGRSRSGSRAGSRSGSRAGSRSGSRSGSRGGAQEEQPERPSTPVIEREIVVGTRLYLQGAGRAADVMLAPPVLQVPGILTVNKMSVHRLRLMNYSDAPVTYEWAAAQAAININGNAVTSGVPKLADAPVEEGVVLAVPRLEMPRGEQEDGPARVRMNPSSGTIQARGHVDVEVSFTALNVGNFELDLPCFVSPGLSTGVVARINAIVAGPRVQILEPEVDFGLIGVGKQSQRIVRFENVSDAPAYWSFQQTDKAALLPSPSPWMRRTPMATPGSIGMPTLGTPGSREKAVLMFEPTAGLLEPHQVTEVRVTCAAGTKPQRLREMFQCVVADGNKAFARVRGEVQSPKVYLDTLDLPLRTVFTNVPVVRTVELSNLSNLDAAWEWDTSLNMAENAPMLVSFSPSSGVLGPKAKQPVRVTFTPVRPARIDTVLICDVKGMPYPLGTAVSATIKGLVVAYSVVGVGGKAAAAAAAEDEEVPGQDAAGEEKKSEELTDPALIAEAAAMKEAAQAGAEVGVMPSLSFGNDLHTFGSRSITMRIHNLSGIPTQFVAEPKHYKCAPQDDSFMDGDDSFVDASVAKRPAAPPMPPGGTRSKTALTRGTRSSMRTGTTGTARRRKLLGIGHEAKDKFQSEAGATMLRERDYRAKMRQMLSLKQGVAFEVTPSTAVLPEWGTMEVTITCVSDMPGKYKDELVVAIDGLEDSRLPIKVGVVGTPLQFMRNTVGLLLEPAIPVLQFGDVLRDSPSVVKTFKIQNTSPMHADLLWKLRTDSSEEPPSVTVDLDATDEGGVNLSITPYSADAALPPFKITPAVARVPAHGETTFTVTAEPQPAPTVGGAPPAEGATWGRFVADANWVLEQAVLEGDDDVASVGQAGGAVGAEGSAATLAGESKSAGQQASATSVHGADGSLDAPSAATLAAPSAGTLAAASSALSSASTLSSACLTLRACINPVVPALQVDKRPTTGGMPFIKYTIWSTRPATHKSHIRQITLANPIPTALTFTVQATGPFSIVNSVTNAPRHPLSTQHKSASHRPLSAGAIRMFTLPHLHNLITDVEFNAAEAATQFLPANPNPASANLSEPKPAEDGAEQGAAAGAGAGAGAGVDSTGTPSLKDLPREKSIVDATKSRLKTQYRGALVITFSNGTVQRVGLRADVLRPVLTAAPPAITFGQVHVERSADQVLYVSNPTTVTADWKLQHMAVPPPKPRVQIDAAALGLAKEGESFSMASLGLTVPDEGPKEVPVDEPGVFSFSSSRGTLAGPTAPLDVADAVPLRSSAADGRGPCLPIHVTFKPTANKLYRSRFRLHVRKGESFDILLTGHGSYEEVHST